ncbi:MAG: hypothetical protein ACO1NS_09075 [Daejeonella sp.]
MKPIVQKTVWLLFIAIASTSCSKDKENCDPSDEESRCYAGVGAANKLLLTEEKTNGKTELQFEYNDRNQVVLRHVHGIDGSITSENLTYTGDKLTKMERKSNGQLVMSEEYSYGTADKPTAAVLKDNKGRVNVNIIYAYSGKRVTETSFDTDGNQLGINTYTFDGKGNQLTRQIAMSGNSVNETLGDYDDKPNRYTNYPWTWKVGSVNNERSYSQSVQIPGGAVSTRNLRWEYEYNEAGYPSKAEVYDKASNTLVETRTFTYKQAN